MYWNIYLSNFFKNHFQNPQDFSLLQKEERSVMDRNHVGYDDKKIYMPCGKNSNLIENVWYQDSIYQNSNYVLTLWLLALGCTCPVR